MELFIFSRLLDREGNESTAAVVLSEQVDAARSTQHAARSEPACLATRVFRSIRDQRLFYIHSRWVDEAAFEIHAHLPRTNRFVEQMKMLIQHPFEATRARPLE